MESGDEFSFGLRQIERHTVGLGNGRDQVDDESQRLHPKEVPTGNAEMTGLLFDYVLEIQCSGLQNDANQSQSQGQFIRNHLGR